MDLADGAGQRGRSNSPAHPPAGDRIGLGQRVDGDCAVLEPRHCRGWDVPARPQVVDVLVYLIGDHEGVVPLAQLRDQGQLLDREDLAGRVVRRVDDDRTGAVGERGTQLGLVERPVRFPQTDEARHGAGQDRIGAVVLVHRVEQDDLVAGVEQRQQRGDHRLGRTTGHADLALGVDAPPGIGPADLRSDGTAEVGGAPGDRVLVEVGVERRLGCLLQLVGAGEVGKALREVDRVVGEGEPGHLADHRLGEAPARTLTRVVPLWDGSGGAGWVTCPSCRARIPGESVLLVGADAAHDASVGIHLDPGAARRLRGQAARRPGLAAASH